MNNLLRGALLKFPLIDSVDFNLLVQDFEEKTNTMVNGYWYFKIGRYIKKVDNGIISLNDGMTLDYYINDEGPTLDEGHTLRDELLGIAGYKVNNYFNSIDIEVYKNKKENMLSANKTRVLKEANVLLISDFEDDYDELIKYGFKNVNYFKSSVRANRYFDKHPEELEKYHIVLIGNQSVLSGELRKKVSKLREKNHLLLSLDGCHYSEYDYTRFDTHLYDNKNNTNWRATELTYKDIFDRILENTLINHTLEKVIISDKKFELIKDYVNPNGLPLPIKKSDLKILYLDSKDYDECASKINETLGLNITFEQDNNSSLDKYVQSLGEYDIIVVTNMHSERLLNMNIESTEQCKDTGRKLTLFVTQDDFYFRIYEDFANGIGLKYVFGGNLAPDYKHHSKEVRILKQPIKFDVESWQEENYQNWYSNTIGIIQSVVNIYNQALIQKGEPALSNLDFKTAEELDQEYVKNKEAIQRAEDALKDAFNSIRNVVTNYLINRESGLVDDEPEDLKITEEEDNVIVDSIYAGRMICSVTFSKKHGVFQIQTMTKKGNLSMPQMVGLYTNKPNEAQTKVLLSIQKKVNHVLKPMNEEAMKKKSKLTQQQGTAFSKKRKRKKKPVS